MARISRRGLLAGGAALVVNGCARSRQAGDGQTVPQGHRQGFDFIVVGAGSAGASVAATLAAQTTANVLLLEAGRVYAGNEVPEDIRNTSVFTRGGTGWRQAFEWPNTQARLTEKQPEVPYEIAKVGGGGSAVNFTIIMRGTDDDYARWDAAGCRGWSAADVLPTFVKIETDPDFGELPYHGKSGPIYMTRRVKPDTWPAFQQALLRAASDLGIPFAVDHNAPGATGASPLTRNIRDGRRVSTNEAYIEPARQRPNLVILDGALVDRVLFEGTRATGVTALVNGERRTFVAPAIILSAGAMNTPALLTRSGIGDPDVLSRLGVRRLVGLRGVGKNLQEHPITFLGDPRKGVETGEGLLMRHALGSGFKDILFFHTGRGLRVALVDPVSRGELVFRSLDPALQPFADFRMLSAEADLARFRDGVLRGMEILRQPAMREFVEPSFSLARKPLPPNVTTQELEDMLLRLTTPFHHVAGTCRMGDSTDPSVVVDTDCRVLGTDGLWVIDASIIPTPVRAPTNLTSIMIGVHAAERLLNAHQRPKREMKS